MPKKIINLIMEKRESVETEDGMKFKYTLKDDDGDLIVKIEIPEEGDDELKELLTEKIEIKDPIEFTLNLKTIQKKLDQD